MGRSPYLVSNRTVSELQNPSKLYTPTRARGFGIPLGAETLLRCRGLPKQKHSDINTKVTGLPPETKAEGLEKPFTEEVKDIQEAVSSHQPHRGPANPIRLAEEELSHLSSGPSEESGPSRAKKQKRHKFRVEL